MITQVLRGIGWAMGCWHGVSNEDECCATGPNWYTYPDYPRRCPAETDDGCSGEWDMYIGEYNPSIYFWFLTEWTTDTAQPYLIILTHEDDGGKIYGSDYFLLIHEDYKEDTEFINNAKDVLQP